MRSPQGWPLTHEPRTRGRTHGLNSGSELRSRGLWSQECLQLQVPAHSGLGCHRTAEVSRGELWFHFGTALKTPVPLGHGPPRWEPCLATFPAPTCVLESKWDGPRCVTSRPQISHQLPSRTLPACADQLRSLSRARAAQSRTLVGHTRPECLCAEVTRFPSLAKAGWWPPHSRQEMQPWKEGSPGVCDGPNHSLLRPLGAPAAPRAASTAGGLDPAHQDQTEYTGPGLGVAWSWDQSSSV